MVLGDWFPIIDWISGYKKKMLPRDVLAGVTTATVVVPQGMGYALLMELPPVVGLYSSLLPTVVYALLGRTRQLSVGPASVVCLVTAASVREAMGASASHPYATLVVLSTLIVGVVMLLSGFGRLGYVQHLLSNPVISGFTAASAAIIVLSELPDLVGVSAESSDHAVTIVVELASQLGGVDWTSLVWGLSAALLMMVGRRWKKRFPGPILLVVLGIALVALGVAPPSLRLIGPVPAGLPRWVLPSWEPQLWLSLLPAALTIGLVAFVQSYAISEIYGGKGKQRVDANRELIALGASNIVGGVFGAFPVTGSLSRTGLNVQFGAKTQLSSLVCVLVILLTVVFVAPVFQFVPRTLLAAIVMVSVWDLLSPGPAMNLWRVHRSDFWQLLVAFFATLLLGVVLGILTSVVVSLGVLLRVAVRPDVTQLGRLPGTKVYRSLDGFPEAETISGLLLFNVQAPLCYANVELIVDRISDAIQAAEDRTWAILVDCRGVTYLDATAAQSLLRFAKTLRRREILFSFTTATPGVADTMRATGLAERIGEDYLFLNNATAVKHMVRHHAPKAVRLDVAERKKTRKARKAASPIPERGEGASRPAPAVEQDGEADGSGSKEG